MTERPELHVKIGEIKIGRSPELLKATLGSCVGIAFSWKKKGLFGLAHCLLPSAPGKCTELGAKYVDQAIQSLLIMMKVSPADYDQLEVHLAGGGNMMKQLVVRNSHHVGLQNVDAARKMLDGLGLKIKAADTQGDAARQIIVDCASGGVEFKKIRLE
ncbi:MAG: chemotaxis protein CheD [Oligoflexia bacterium]|nr:chemotaxis protein CheD [Oligoflexia bacterium]